MEDNIIEDQIKSVRIAVYTAIFGNKDLLGTPLNYRENPAIEYFCFTDNMSLTSEVYHVHLLHSEGEEPTRMARKIKILGHPLLENFDYHIWHDGNISIDHSSIFQLIAFGEKHMLATFKHPIRNCFYEEARMCGRRHKDELLKVVKQVNHYYINGLKSQSGLFETGILVKNNNLRKNKFYEFWWENVSRFTNRDQMALPFVLSKFGEVLNVIPGDGRKNEFSYYYKHKNKLPFELDLQNKLKRKLVYHYVFLIKYLASFSNRNE